VPSLGNDAIIGSMIENNPLWNQNYQPCWNAVIQPRMQCLALSIFLQCRKTARVRVDALQ
jgi:hypothetical protein